MECIAATADQGLWDCDCRECIALQEEADAMLDGPTCSICDGAGHGFPGGPPCPLEMGGPDDGFDRWEEDRGVRALDPQWG